MEHWHVCHDVGGANSRMASWRPHILVSMYLIWHLILVRVIVWLEYPARCVLGAVYSCCTPTPLSREESMSVVFYARRSIL